MIDQGERGNLTRALDARTCALVAVFAILSVLCLMVRAEDMPKPAVVSPLDRGFSGLYNLDFAGAQKDFTAWQRLHPDDPVGPVSEAAGFLFDEFNRLGVLEAQFYENDKAFEGRPKLTPDPALRNRFESAIGRADRTVPCKTGQGSEGSRRAVCLDSFFGFAGGLRCTD